MKKRNNNYSPLVSVVMTVYSERPEWIKASIYSVLNQSYTNLELIIVYDNPNNQATWQQLTNLSNKDGRINLVRNSENIGLTKSLNVGLHYIRGHFIARIDADDVWKPEKLKKQISYLEKHPQIDGVGSCVDFIGEDGNFIQVMDFPITPKRVACRIVTANPIIHSSIVLRVSSVNEMLPHLYDEKFYTAQDYALWAKLIFLGKRLSNLSERLVEYRRSLLQITKTRSCEQKNNANLIKERFVYEIAEKCGIKDIELMDVITLSNLVRSLRPSLEKSIIYTYLYNNLYSSTLTKKELLHVIIHSHLLFDCPLKDLLKIFLK